MKTLAAVLAPLAAAIGFHAAALTSGPVRASTYASYPPSCLSAPLTDRPSGPVATGTASLTTAQPDTNAPLGVEPVDFTFWRVPCEGGKSALLLRIARRPDARPGTAVVLWNADLRAQQGAASGSIRLATEPGTLSSSLQAGARIFSDLTVVLENFPQDIAYASGAVVPQALPAFVTPARFDFNQTLDVSLPTASTVGITPPPPLQPPVSIPAYDPTAYADASLPMPITGYNVGNYYDPVHNGEGIVVEVGTESDANALPLRYVNVAWYTFDANGNALWLFGTRRFTAGDRIAQVPLSYFSGGGFAGAFGASAQRQPWGTVTIAFPDCRTMELTYVANAGLPAPIPSGTGTRTWTRLSEETGLACR